MISGVLAHDLDKVWLVVEPELEKACRRSTDGTTTQQLYEWVKNREAQLWLCPDAVFVTRIVIYPHCKALQITSCGGKNMKRWLPEAKTLFEAYARFHQCDRMEIIGRIGWKRVFKDARVASITLIKELA